MMMTLTFVGARFWQRGTAFFDNFFLKPASARPLAAFRIGLSLLLLWQAFVMRKSFLGFFARIGFVQGDVSNVFSVPLAPRFDWLIDIFARMGFSETIALTSLGLLYVTTLLSLLFGSFTRLSAFLAWFLHWSFMNTGYSGSYGADTYAHFFLFYLIFVPCGEAYSLDRYFNKLPGLPSYQARLGLRVLQLHMCISYLASGLEKATGEQWWNGELMWRALNTPGYSIGNFLWLAQIPVLAMLGGWFVLVIETFYCIMIWPRKTRTLWIALTCLLHLGIAIFLKLPIFGVLMCIPTLTLFAVSSEPNLDKARSC
jgi:hypothetical protein